MFFVRLPSEVIDLLDLLIWDLKERYILLVPSFVVNGSKETVVIEEVGTDHMLEQAGQHRWKE